MIGAVAEVTEALAEGEAVAQVAVDWEAVAEVMDEVV